MSGEYTVRMGVSHGTGSEHEPENSLASVRDRMAQCLGSWAVLKSSWNWGDGN